MSIPVVPIKDAESMTLAGGAAGVGRAVRKQLEPGDYVAIVSGSDVLVRDGEAEALSLEADPALRSDVVLVLRLERGILTAASSSTEDATLWLIPVAEYRA